MTPTQETKQKILALLTVFFLFAIVGSLLFSISLDNKHKTEILKAKVAKIKAEKEIIEKLAKIQTATSTLTDITAESYLTIAITDNGLEKILQYKNPDYSLPIASITKLMVAVITLENIRPDIEIKATTDYIGLEESVFVLETDKIYTVKELLANTLIASDNDSARLLSSTLGTDNFIIKMNIKAQELGLTKTNYFNVTGLDPIKPDLNANLSSPNDLAKLLVYIKAKHPEILRLTTNATYDFCDINNYCKVINSTDKLLSDESFKYKIIGGKTGSTDLAGKNLALMTSATTSVSIINIVLGAKDHFKDTQALINNIIIN
jgi:D-alanyl-D-alanine carboxypeptidase